MDLYPELTRQGFLEGAIARARRDLTVQLQGNTFRIYFEGRDPVQAARTAHGVEEALIESNLKLRENQAQGTSTFLETELGKTKRRLEIQEAKIAEFKRQNLGDLPEQRDTNLRGVEQLQTKLEINVDALDKAETRRLLLQSQMAELRNQQGGSRRSTLVALGVAPATPDQPSHLDQLRAQLAELRARHTDRHPDVIRTRAEIAQPDALEKSQQGESFTILERALPPTSPYGPNKILVLGLGLIAGGLVGLLAALLRERSDHTYPDVEALQQAFPGLPVLATIPVFQGARSASRTRRR